MYKIIKAVKNEDINSQKVVCTKVFKNINSAVKFAKKQNEQIKTKVLGFIYYIYDQTQNTLKLYS